MSKKQLTSTARYAKYVVLAGLFVLFGTTAVLALRSNNQRMIVLKNAVFEADKKDGDVEGALRELRQFVHAHMNTNLAAGPSAVKPPIQLKYRYERLVAAEEARVEAINSRIYTDAQKTCEKKFPVGLSGSGRIPCVKAYIDAHDGAKEQPIPSAAYTYDFISPAWSPDLAGWSLVVAGLSLLASLVLLLRDLSVRSALRD